MTDLAVYFVPNNQRGTWPTFDEVLRWDAQNSYPGITGGLSSAPAEAVALALDAATERASHRCHIQVQPVDTAGEVDPDGDPVLIPAGVKLWVIMEAVRLVRHRHTPDGMAGSAELGTLMRVSGFDAHAETLISPWLDLAY
jgi:hypothetical protein